MDASTRSPKMKVTAVFAAVGMTAAFAVGGTLAYLSDYDTHANEVGFLMPERADEGLITLTEATWDADTTGTGPIKGAAYAARGILPGDTLAKDPKVTINAWKTSDGRTVANSQPLYVFMKVTVPTADVAGSNQPLFDYTTNAGWALIARNDSSTDDDGNPAVTYVYAYTGSAVDAGTTTASRPTPAATPKASTYGTDLPELFTTVTYLGSIDAAHTPTGERDIVVDAYAIQAESLGTTDALTIYKLASGEDAGQWA